MISRVEFISNLEKTYAPQGRHLPDDELEHIKVNWDTAYEAAVSMLAKMPGSGFLFVRKKIKAFVACCRVLDQMVNRDEIDNDQALLALMIASTSNKPFNKAMDAFEGHLSRYRAVEKSQLPHVAQLHMHNMGY